MHLGAGDSWVIGELQALGCALVGAFCSAPISGFNGGTFSCTTKRCVMLQGASQRMLVAKTPFPPAHTFPKTCCTLV